MCLHTHTIFSVFYFLKNTCKADRIMHAFSTSRIHSRIMNKRPTWTTQWDSAKNITATFYALSFYVRGEFWYSVGDQGKIIINSLLYIEEDRHLVVVTIRKYKCLRWWQDYIPVVDLFLQFKHELNTSHWLISIQTGQGKLLN